MWMPKLDIYFAATLSLAIRRQPPPSPYAPWALMQNPNNQIPLPFFAYVINGWALASLAVSLINKFWQINLCFGSA